MTDHDPPITSNLTSNLMPDVTPNPWHALRRFTAARIALGRAGVSVPTQPQLAFQLAHAQARDAVHQALDVEALATRLQAVAAQMGVVDQAILQLDSAAADRLVYLQRPDLGRRLSAASIACLQAQGHGAGMASAQRAYDLAFVIGDGLSARAIDEHAVPLLAEVARRIAPEQWRIAPLAIVRQARVAVADEVGQWLGAKLVVILIGERPGLSSPDSLGLYLTWMPSVGLTDAARNCISNVRPAGLSFAQAAYKLHYLMAQAHQRGLTGVALKDESAHEAQDQGAGLAGPGNFLLD